MKKPFWKDGIRFECQGSGQCCTSHGQYGYVYMTAEDRRRMAKVLKMRTSAFTRKYCDQTEGYYHLKEFEGDCRFLSNRRCTVYEGRPNQCRTWPFWSDNMNAKTWNKEIMSFCPGVGKGKLYTEKEINNLLEIDRQED